MIHKTKLPSHQGNWPELAEQLGDLRYDALSNFIQALSQKMRKDADADLGRQRIKLAGELQTSADELQAASEAVARAWTICKPYMTDDQ